MTIYAARGDISRELLSYGGKVLTHDNEGEMAFLLAGCTIVPLPSSFKAEDTMRLQDHPGLEAVRWPLRRADFIRKAG